MLVFAYDGTLHGDWVAHYAIRFAATGPDRRLRLIHVDDAAPTTDLADRLARITAEAALCQVALEPVVVASGRADVPGRILEHTPAGATVITGTRARPRARSFLAGTATAHLLRESQVGVIALHIVQPGVLGQPGRILVPVVDRDASAARALPLLQLLGPDLDHLHLVHIRTRSPWRGHLQSARAREREVADDARHLAAIERALCAALPTGSWDTSSVTAVDVAHEIAVQAARHRARLICLDADPTHLPRHPRPGVRLEQVLRAAPADVAIHRGPA